MPIEKGLAAVKPILRRFAGAGGEIAKRWFRHDHSPSAAALALYSLFSLVPLLVISTKFAGKLIGAEAAQAEVSSPSEGR